MSTDGGLESVDNLELKAWGADGRFDLTVESRNARDNTGEPFVSRAVVLPAFADSAVSGNSESLNPQRKLPKPGLPLSTILQSVPDQLVDVGSSLNLGPFLGPCNTVV